MRPTRLRRVPRLVVLAASLLAAPLFTASCTISREPPHDPAIAGAVLELAQETNLLFEGLAAAPREPYEARAAQYRLLAARAATIRMLAEARGIYTAGAVAEGPGLAERLIGTVELPGGVSPEAAALVPEYRDATQAFMDDFVRNIRLLEAEDARAGDAGTAAFEAAMAAHRAEIEAYLAAWTAWEAGTGPRPAAVGPAPEPAAPGLSEAQVALRRAALTDILRDSLVYERDILDRNR